MPKVKGIKCKVQIFEPGDEFNSKPLAGQRNATLNRSAEAMDATDKDSEWRENEQGIKEWSIDCDGLLVESDEAYETLEDIFMSDGKVGVLITMPSGKKYQGTAIITDFPIEFPYDDMVTYSASFTGSGPLEKLNGTGGGE